MPKSLAELRSCAVLAPITKKRREIGPTRTWKTNGIVCSYTSKPFDILERAHQRAFKHNQEKEEHVRSHAEIFIAYDINPP